ncbi:MAG: MATE family efflux transporter [Nitrospinaceae bacterium]|jgi:putative MATE family efflux protein|nr:MATE family efflux transporter [Nitrospinaceae bacterium]MBT3434324.1 MATE family efflux transporter [Nitrospinaceae bacterium]MBT3820088.1 MATE family efflux transporter [Nitrospinaceae bacterium]MBT4094979.1 MATE family efflux transporter [Nitrospinaceae bacterium]MBT4432250.1 MATE family efflux transporter [Nitrospinaceae bacterium]
MSRQVSATKVRYDYTKGSIRRGLSRLAVPVFFELTAWNIDVVIELYWVGRLGANALAAMSLGFIFVAASRSLGMGIRTAGQALVAQRVGAGDLEGASLTAGQVIILHTLCFTLITIAGLVSAPYLMAALSSDTEIIRLGTIYLRASFIVVMFIDGIFTLASIFRGAGEPGYSLMGMIVNTIAVFISIPLLVYGAGPLPALGLAGTPLGLGAGRLTGALLMLFFLFTGKSRIHLKPNHLLPRYDLLSRIINLGWPICGQNLFERTANIVLIKIISPFGALALAAWGVGSRVSQMGRMPGFALQGAVRTMVGQNIGARHPDRARAAAWYTISIVFSILLLTTSVVFIWAEEVIHFFGLKGDAAPAGVICFRILCLGTLFEGTRRVLAGIFEGASQTKPPMFVEAIARWAVMLPIAYAASTLFGMAELGIWWAVSISHILGGLALFTWFVFGWRRKADQKNQVN